MSTDTEALRLAIQAANTGTIDADGSTDTDRLVRIVEAARLSERQAVKADRIAIAIEALEAYIVELKQLQRITDTKPSLRLEVLRNE